MKVTRPGGIEIPYGVEGDGSGSRLVFAHGLTGQSAHVREEVRPLVRAGWTVAAFDQRGHANATPVTDPALYDAEAMGADLWAVADALGWDRCWIGGGSMGAATSYTAALQAPERVEGLLQVVPALQDKPHDQIAMFQVYSTTVRERGIDGAIELVKQFISAGTDLPPEAIERIEDMRAHDAKSLACALDAVPKWVIPGAPSRLAELDVPIIVFGHKGDVIHPWETAQRYAAASPRCVLIEGDFAKSQTDRELVGRLLLEALERVTAKT
jgi:pimeloyl-ACP methyl ester carboxylesterase